MQHINAVLFFEYQRWVVLFDPRVERSELYRANHYGILSLDLRGLHCSIICHCKITLSTASVSKNTQRTNNLYEQLLLLLTFNNRCHHRGSRMFHEKC
ncbi:hypothetical protein BC938DRAFT_470871 [Jimgerdemannia flammicorona]|uniref:Uncharacterized protein n=1 Tax=Jimgerdemannia flammicorona TaxID=994334 RepID=A0A433Q996_9FUNG|nr:hypothetical protein BC938DRAFT_470871 [Jimgerdemannia flammicorona]